MDHALLLPLASFVLGVVFTLAVTALIKEGD